jgi:hypothetical protein
MSQPYTRTHLGLALSPVSAGPGKVAVNTTWAARNEALPNPADVLVSQAKPKHHKTAEQRARQLTRTQYIKGGKPTK